MALKIAFRIGLVVLSAAVLQRGLFSQLRIGGITADLFLLLAVVGGLTAGPDRGAVMGFISGLTIDLLLQSPLGLTALTYCVVGFVSGRYQLSVTRSSRWRLMLTTGVASALGYGLLVVVGWVLGQRNMLTDRLPAVLLMVGVTNALLAPLAVRVLRWAWAQPPARTFGMNYGS